MSLSSMDELNEIHFDVLKEIGNIGHGNAATSLSQMLGRMVDVEVPDVKLLNFGETAEYLGGPEQIVLGMMIVLDGDIKGMMMYALQKEFALSMVKTVLGTEHEELFELSEMELSFIQEIGNILAGSYVNAISSLTGFHIEISVPTVTIDMAGAILAVPAVQFAQYGSKVLFIDDRFIFSDDSGGKGEIKSNMILIPELSSLEKLFERLGMGL